MPIKDILFHLEPDEATQSVSRFAVSLAEATGAHLTAAGVVIDFLPPATDVSGFSAGWDLVSAEVFAEISDRNRKDTEQAYERLMAAVPAGVQTELVMIKTFREIAVDEFGRLSRHFDLSVVSQRASEVGQGDQMMITGALFGSGRPVFVVPSGYNRQVKLEKVIVCWDGRAQAARAVADALPLLSKARSVEIVCVGGVDQAGACQKFRVSPERLNIVRSLPL